MVTNGNKNTNIVVNKGTERSSKDKDNLIILLKGVQVVGSLKEQIRVESFRAYQLVWGHQLIPILPPTKISHYNGCIIQWSFMIFTLVCISRIVIKCRTARHREFPSGQVHSQVRGNCSVSTLTVTEHTRTEAHLTEPPSLPGGHEIHIHCALHVDLTKLIYWGNREMKENTRIGTTLGCYLIFL